MNEVLMTWKSDRKTHLMPLKIAVKEIDQSKFGYGKKEDSAHIERMLLAGEVLETPHRRFQLATKAIFERQAS